MEDSRKRARQESSGESAMQDPISPASRRLEGSGETDPSSVEDVISTEAEPVPYDRSRMEYLDLQAALAERAMSRYAIDESAPLPPKCTFPIEPTHPLARDWPRFKNEVFNALTLYGIDWSAVEIFYRRRSQTEVGKGPTILITTETIIPNWPLLETKILSICRSNKHYNVDVEIAYGVVSRSAGIYANLAEKPDGGTSLGVRGLAWSSGTLGGYITLNWGSRQATFALTCHHVLRPTKLASSALESSQSPALESSQSSSYDAILDEVNKYHEAVPYRPGEHTTNTVAQPSFADMEETLSRLGTGMKTVEDQISALEHRLAMGAASTSTASNLERLRDQKGNWERLVNSAKSHNTLFGYVTATSGYALSGNPAHPCSLDWGIVEVCHSRIGENKIPPYDPSAPNPISQTMASGTINHYDSGSEGSAVLKSGRSSGVTYGIVNGAQSNVFLPGGQESIEYAVVSPDMKLFSKGGDSGAWVIDSSGSLIGMVIGQGIRGQTYITPIIEVFKDIEEKTGAKVSLL